MIIDDEVTPNGNAEPREPLHMAVERLLEAVATMIHSEVGCGLPLDDEAIQRPLAHAVQVCADAPLQPEQLVDPPPVFVRGRVMLGARLLQAGSERCITERFSTAPVRASRLTPSQTHSQAASIGRTAATCVSWSVTPSGRLGP